MNQFKLVILKKITNLGSSKSIYFTKIIDTDNPLYKKDQTIKIVSTATGLDNGDFVYCEGKVEDSKYGKQLVALKTINDGVKSLDVDYQQLLNWRELKGYKNSITIKYIEKYKDDFIFNIEKYRSSLQKELNISDDEINTFCREMNRFKEYYQYIKLYIQDGLSLKGCFFHLDKNELAYENNKTKTPLGISYSDISSLMKIMGIGTSSKDKVIRYIEHTVDSKINSGHTLVFKSALVDWAEKELKLDRNIINYHIDRLITLKFFKEIRLNNNVVALSRNEIYNTSINIYKNIRRLQDKPTNYVINIPSDSFLNKEQISAINTSVNNKVSIITGGPGVGKTTVMNEVLKQIEDIYGKINIRLVAPTGKAATRMFESTGRNAETIHQLIKANFEGKAVFNKNNLLDIDLLVIDEYSMVDEAMTEMLLSALPDKCRLIILGDVDQIPSVNPGKVLRDLIDSNSIPCTRLIQTVRQKSSDQRENSIISVGRKIINRDETISEKDISHETVLRKIGEKYGDQFNDQAVNEIKTIVNDLISKNVSPDDIQVLTPRKGTKLGTQNLNDELQPLFNKGSKNKITRFNRTFMIDDRVMFLKNNHKDGYTNGLIGKVTSISHEDRTVTVSCSLNNENKDISLSFNDLDVLDLAYAKTLHKSQGSEYKYVIMPLSYEHANMLYPELIYTGITRAKLQFFFVGDNSMLKKSYENKSSTRFTILGEVLNKNMEVDFYRTIDKELLSR